MEISRWDGDLLLRLLCVNGYSFFPSYISVVARVKLITFIDNPFYYNDLCVIGFCVFDVFDLNEFHEQNSLTFYVNVHSAPVSRFRSVWIYDNSVWLIWPSARAHSLILYAEKKGKSNFEYFHCCFRSTIEVPRPSPRIFRFHSPENIILINLLWCLRSCNRIKIENFVYATKQNESMAGWSPIFLVIASAGCDDCFNMKWARFDMADRMVFVCSHASSFFFFLLIFIFNFCFVY